MSINIEDIYPLTDFKQHSGKFQTLLQQRKSAIVLTVNGKAAFVLQDAISYQQTMNRLTDLETELKALKEQQFRDAVLVGVQQLESGHVSNRSNEDIFQAAIEAEKEI